MTRFDEVGLENIEELIYRVSNTDFAFTTFRTSTEIFVPERTLIAAGDILCYQRGLEQAIEAVALVSQRADAAYIHTAHSLLLLHFRGDVFDAYNFAFSPSSLVFYAYPSCTTVESKSLKIVDMFEHSLFGQDSFRLASCEEVEDESVLRIMESRVPQYLAAAWLTLDHDAKGDGGRC